MAPRLDRDLGLEVHAELLALDRAAQGALGVQARERALPRDLVEEHQPAAARLLRAVHRGVGVADEVLDVLVGIAGAARCRGSPTDMVSPCERWNGMLKRPQDPLGDRHRVLLVDDVLAEDRELVAAEAGDDLVAAERVPQALGHRDDQLVARG